MAFLTTDCGHRVHFDHHRARSDGGRTVMLIHGWAMSGDCWVSTVETLLAAGHAAIVMDHRGCGRSDRDFADVSIGAIASDAAAIARQCGADNLVINGWSLGGAVAVEAARLLENRVSALVLTCAASPRYVRTDDFPHGGEAADVAGIADAVTSNRAPFFRALATGACAEGADPAIVAWLERMFLSSGPGITATLMDLIELDQRALLSSFDFPVLSIGGAKDTVADPAIAAFAAKCARRGELVSFADCGHSPHLEDAAAYGAALLAFLKGLE